MYCGGGGEGDKAWYFRTLDCSISRQRVFYIANTVHDEKKFCYFKLKNYSLNKPKKQKEN